jgi:hypothetical protein
MRNPGLQLMIGFAVPLIVASYYLRKSIKASAYPKEARPWEQFPSWFVGLEVVALPVLVFGLLGALKVALNTMPSPDVIAFWFLVCIAPVLALSAASPFLIVRLRGEAVYEQYWRFVEMKNWMPRAIFWRFLGATAGSMALTAFLGAALTLRQY